MNHIEILSNPSTEDFSDEWYEIATENHFWLKWRLRVFLADERYWDFQRRYF